MYVIWRGISLNLLQDKSKCVNDGKYGWCWNGGNSSNLLFLASTTYKFLHADRDFGKKLSWFALTISDFKELSKVIF